jgi:hypothetical protein
MAKQIWKYQIVLKVDGVFWLDMPKGARILKLALQKGKPTLWAMVDINANTETRKFNLYLTGSPIVDEEEYIGSVLLDDGDFVLHLFEITNTE